MHNLLIKKRLLSILRLMQEPKGLNAILGQLDPGVGNKLIGRAARAA